MSSRTRLSTPLRLLIAALVAVLLVEGTVRVRQWWKYGTFGRIHQFEKDPATGLLVPLRDQQSDRIHVNSLGFRGGEIESPKPDGRIRLAFLGGSTTFCAEASSDETTWPNVCAQKIRALRRERDFDFVNAGVGGYTLEKIEANLAQRVLPLAPDVVVVYEATNDIGHQTRELAREQGLEIEDGEESWLARVSLAWFLAEKNVLVRLRGKAALSAESALRFDPEVLAAAFEERLVAIVREARAGGRLAVLVTFCPRVRAEQTEEQRLEACETSLYYMPYMTPELVLGSFEAYNRAIRRAAERTGAVLVEAEGRIPADDVHFNDSVHLKDPGLALLGEIVAEGILAAPQFRNAFP